MRHLAGRQTISTCRDWVAALEDLCCALPGDHGFALLGCHIVKDDGAEQIDEHSPSDRMV